MVQPQDDLKSINSTNVHSSHYLDHSEDIPSLIQSQQVSPSQKKILILCHNLSFKMGFCYASNEALSSMSNIPQKTIENALSALKKSNMIEVIGSNNQHGEREIYVNVDVLKQYHRDTQAFLMKKKQELDELAAMRKETEKLRKEYAEKYREINGSQDFGKPSGNHRESSNNVPVINRSTNQKNNNTVVVENENISSSERKKDSEYPELSALAQDFDVPQTFLSVQMKKFDKDIAFMRQLLFYAKERAESNLRGYVVQCLRDGWEPPEQPTHEIEARHKSTNTVKQNDEKSQNETHGIDTAQKAVRIESEKPKTKEEIIADLERMIETKKAYYNKRIRDLQRNHDYYQDIQKAGQQEIDALRRKLEKVKA